MYRLLCIDDDKDFLLALRIQLMDKAMVVPVENCQQALNKLAEENFDAVLLDVQLRSESGLQGIQSIKQAFPDIDIMMLSGQRDPKVIVEAIRAGASDYITKPFVSGELLALIERMARDRKLRERYTALVADSNQREQRDVVGKSKALQQVLQQVKQLEGHNANVLIVGETGTGKEMLARALHTQENVKDRPFVAVNCAAIPENLLEAELFGVEKGAFTGAHKRRIGKFELADGGDIFLDEISSLKLSLQAKLLRVLQEREFARLGGNQSVKVNFRVIAASNEQLEEKVAKGEFRMDLYHRLRVIQLTLPALRERREDIPVLAEYFLCKHAAKKASKQLAPEALERLLQYNWHGNVRELENVIQSLIILSSGSVIEESDLPEWAFAAQSAANNIPSISPVFTQAVDGSESPSSLRDYQVQAERNYIQYVLKDVAGGDKTKAARMLNVGRTTLYAKLKEFGIVC